MTSPYPASPVSIELPEEIATAIRHLTSVCIAAPGFNDAMAANRNIRNGVEALTAAILSRLREGDAALARVEGLEKALGDAASDFDSIANSADPFDDAVGTQDHGLLLAVEKMAGAAGEKVRSALSEAPSQGDQ